MKGSEATQDPGDDVNDGVVDSHSQLGVDTIGFDTIGVDTIGVDTPSTWT